MRLEEPPGIPSIPVDVQQRALATAAFRRLRRGRPMLRHIAAALTCLKHDATKQISDEADDEQHYSDRYNRIP